MKKQINMIFAILMIAVVGFSSKGFASDVSSALASDLAGIQSRLSHLRNLVKFHESDVYSGKQGFFSGNPERLESTKKEIVALAKREKDLNEVSALMRKQRGRSTLPAVAVVGTIAATVAIASGAKANPVHSNLKIDSRQIDLEVGQTEAGYADGGKSLEKSGASRVTVPSSTETQERFPANGGSAVLSNK